MPSRARSDCPTAWFPNPDGWLEESIEAATVAIPAFNDLDGVAQESVTEQVKQEVEPFLKELTIDGQLALPMHPQIVHATCP